MTVNVCPEAFAAMIVDFITPSDTTMPAQPLLPGHCLSALACGNPPLSLTAILPSVDAKIRSTLLGRVDLCCTFRVQQYIGSHINMNAS
ncbi:hypothetical protein AB6E09_09455, partial [Vibrio lentus]